MSLNQLMAVAVVGLVGCVGISTLFGKKVSENIKDSKIFEEGINLLKNHKGAVHFLGDPIELRTARFNSLGYSDTNKLDVRINVAGPKSAGIAFLTVLRDEANNSTIESVQLQIGKDDTKRLVIK